MSRALTAYSILAFALAFATACSPSDPADPTPTPHTPLIERPAPGEVRAGQIKEHAERLVGGAADSKIGDWKLMNHEAVFVVSDVNHKDVYLLNSGALIDADIWRDGDSWDQIYSYAPMLGSVYKFEGTHITLLSDGLGEDKQAILRVDGFFKAADLLGGIFGFDINPYKHAVTGSTYYRLKPDTRALEIETVVYNVSNTAQNIHGGDALIPSDHFGMPFVIGGGFERTSMNGPTEMMGSLGERNELFFGLTPAGQHEYMLPSITALVSSGLPDMMLFLANQTQCKLQPGHSCSWQRYATVAESPARARTAALALQGLTAKALSGQITGEPSGTPVAGARVFLTPSHDPDHVIDLDVSDGAGQFNLHPRGFTEVTIWARPTDRGETAMHPEAQPPVPHAEGYLPADPMTIRTSEATGTLALTMSEPAMVTLRLKDTSGTKIPGKFSFAVTEPTHRNPVFDEESPYRYIRKVVWQAHADDITVAIPPGTYDIYASLGIEYELHQKADQVLVAGEEYEFDFVLTRSVDLTGWAQCDTHLHTSYSNHGRTSHTDRVITLVADGVNCAAITDHDRIFDFQPLVRTLGLEDRVLTFPATEVSTFLRGHINPYPIYPDYDKVDPDSRLPVQGDRLAVPWWEEGWTIPRLFERMRELGADVIQINHGSGVGGYFTMTGYDPETGAGGPEYSSKFDVLELTNGRQVDEAVDELKEIAFSLWDRGQRKTVVGVSDSHYRIPEAGYSRTLVRVAEDWHADMHEAQPVAGLLAMDAVVANGVFVDMTVSGAGYGETVTGKSHTVSMKVRAPSWVPLDGFTATLYYNNREIEVYNISVADFEAASGTWLATEYMLAEAEDGWLALEVREPEPENEDDNKVDLWPVAPGANPYAMTNPIFVDVDGNGWTPPKDPVPEGVLSTQYSPLEIGHSHGGGHHHHH